MFTRWKPNRPEKLRRIFKYSVLPVIFLRVSLTRRFGVLCVTVNQVPNSGTICSHPLLLYTGNIAVAEAT